MNANPPLDELLEVILITYNRAADLDATLLQLRNSPLVGCKLTILDNASTDKTPDICAKHAPHFSRFSVRRTPFNIGGNANYLRAVETAQMEYVWIICDDDDFDFSNFGEVAEAVTSRKYDLISLGAHNHTVLPRGVEIRTQELIKDSRFNFFYTSCFIPCTIFKTSTMTSAAVLRGYHGIQTLFPQLFYFADTVRQNLLLYITRNNFITNRQENVGYRPLHLVIGWLLVANALRADNPASANAMLRELLGRHFYPQKIAQYTFLQRGFVNQYPVHDACKLAKECLKAGPIWFLKVFPFVCVLFLPGFVSRMLWRASAKIVFLKEGRTIKRPSRIEFASGQDERG